LNSYGISVNAAGSGCAFCPAVSGLDRAATAGPGEYAEKFPPQPAALRATMYPGWRADRMVSQRHTEGSYVDWRGDRHSWLAVIVVAECVLDQPPVELVAADDALGVHAQ